MSRGAVHVPVMVKAFSPGGMSIPRRQRRIQGPGVISRRSGGASANRGRRPIVRPRAPVGWKCLQDEVGSLASGRDNPSGRNAACRRPPSCRAPDGVKPGSIRPACRENRAGRRCSPDPSRRRREREERMVHDLARARPYSTARTPFVFGQTGRENGIAIDVSPSAGTVYGAGISRIRSGLPSCHPS